MSFIGVKNNHSGLGSWYKEIVNAINSILNGKTNNTGTFTLTANDSGTTVYESPGRIGNNTVILITPTTQKAAQEMATGNMYVSLQSVSGSYFLISHSNTADEDKRFSYILVG